MAARPRRPAPDSPFLSHALRGWASSHPRIRHPVTFGVYQEGRNHTLYLAPTGLASIRDSLGFPADDLAIVVGDDGRGRALPWAHLASAGVEADLVHLPAGTSPSALDPTALPVPLLASPSEAVPVELGSRVAISLHDACHGALIARDRDVLAAALRGFLEEYIVSALGREATLPALPDALITALLEPLPPDAWYVVAFETHRRYWILEASLNGERGQGARWVCEGEGGRWRAGWSW